MKVSIIIPIYNVEKYIARCINSVLNQTYRNLEIILIDDCTPDRSMEIAKQIVENSNKAKDLEIKYISHPQNKGIAATRNTGMRNVSGEYFFFLDSDDEITPDCIESMVTLALKYKGVDIIQGDTLDTNNNKIRNLDFTNLPEYISDKSTIKKLLFNDGTLEYNIPNVVWNKLIRTALIKDNSMWFKEGIISEDVYWLIMYWRFVDSIVLTSQKTYYYYNDNPESITNESNKKKKYFISYMKILKDFIPTIEYDDIYIYRHFIKLLHNYGIHTQSKQDQRMYRETILYIIKQNHLPFKVKLSLYYLLIPSFFVRIKIIDLIYKVL